MIVMNYIKSSNVKYRKLIDHRNCNFVDEQFLDQERTRPIPFKGIIYAFALFSIGSSLLILTSLYSIGFFSHLKLDDRVWSLLIIGLLMFLPGAYHLRIAIYAFLGYPSYTFDDIPEFC